MKRDAIQAELDALAAVDGVRAVALVEISTGFVYESAGAIAGLEAQLESATDYWRLSRRLAEVYADMGAVAGQSIVHEKALVNIMPCGDGDVVCVTIARRKSIDWSRWPARLASIAAIVAGDAAPPLPAGVEPAGVPRVTGPDGPRSVSQPA